MDRKQVAAEFRTAARSLQKWVMHNGVIRSADMEKQKELAGLVRDVDDRALRLGIVCPEIKRRSDETEGTPIGNYGLVRRPGRTTTALPDNCSDAWILDGDAQWSKAIDSMVFVADQIAAEGPKAETGIDDSKWPGQRELARRLGINSGDVHRLLESGKLRDNGKTGSHRRIDPLSILEYCNANQLAYNVDSDHS